MICNQGLAKANIEKALSRPGGFILTDEINTLLYTAKSDRDLDFLLEAIQKHETQSGEYSFGTPLMKICYIRNKTDKALELFMSNVIATLKTTFVLMQIELLKF
jgi:hypothetical protein